jgi:general stress protein YciG
MGISVINGLTHYILPYDALLSHITKLNHMAEEKGPQKPRRGLASASEDIREKVARKGGAAPHQSRGLAAADALTRSRVARAGGKARALNTEGLRHAGKKGGEMVKSEYGTPFYQSIGGRGGHSVKEKYGIQFYRDIGEKGGAVVKEKYGSGFYRDIGKKGAQKLKDRSSR